MPSVQGQMENPAVDYGLHTGGAGAAHKVADWLRRRAAGHLHGRRRDDRLRPAGQPAHPVAGGGGAVRARHGAGAR